MKTLGGGVSIGLLVAGCTGGSGGGGGTPELVTTVTLRALPRISR